MHTAHTRWTAQQPAKDSASPPAPAATTAAAASADSGAAFTVSPDPVWKPKPYGQSPSSSSAPSRPRAVSPMVLPRWLERLSNKLRGGFGTLTALHGRKLYNFIRAHPLATPTTAELKQWQQEQEAMRVADPTRHAARDPRLILQRLSLPVGEITRFRLIGLHLWLLNKMMLASLSGPASQHQFLTGVDPDAPVAKATMTKHQLRLMEHIFENFWLELTPFLRDSVGELKVGKSLENVQIYFYTAWLSLDIAWTQAKTEQWERNQRRVQGGSRPSGSGSGSGSAVDASSSTQSTPELQGLESFAASVWRNFFMSDESVSKRDVYRLVYYMLVQLDHLSSLNQDPASTLDSRDWFWSVTTVPMLCWSNVGLLGTVSEPAEALMEKRLGVSRRAWAEDGTNSFALWKKEINMDDLEIPRA